MTDRGVSEVIGFVLIFSLVTATIGMVYATGFSGLDDARNDEQVENMARAFDVLDDNVDDLSRQGAPSRATEIKLAGGSIRMADRINASVTVTNNSEPNDNASFELHPNPLVYDTRDGQTVEYVLGSTFRSNGAGTAMATKPDFEVDSRRAIFPMIGTYRSGSTNIAGHSTVHIVASVNSRRIPISFSTGAGHDATLNVTIDSSSADAWQRYFEANGYNTTTISGTTVSANRTVSDDVYVSFTSVTVEFDV